MLRLSNNRIFLWQWDADQTLVVEREDVTEVHFRDLSGEVAMVLDVIENDGKHIVPIPNVLLTEAKPIDAYAYRIAGDMATLEHITIEVKARQRPADYVYTETEVKRWETLEERIAALEQGGGGGGIAKETDPTVPDWAKQPEKPTYTAEEVGAATKESVDKLSEEIDDLKESGGAADAVRYTEQTLTDAQKTQARMNLWQQVPSENLFNKETVVVGEYLAPTGEPVASANLRYAFVPLTGAGTYACAVPGSKLGFSNGNYKKIPIYDAGKNYLMTIEGTSNDTTSAVDNKVVFVVSDADISNGAAYMGFNIEKTMLDSVMVVKSGSYPERYIPYSPTIGIPEFGISVESVRAFEVNPLYGKIATFTGDSICEARENNGGGYATLIGNRNAMVVENLGVSGGRITVGTEKFCITESVNSMRTDADYVILEGGVNDAAANNLGEISDNFNSTLDTATFCGAFEQMVKNAIARFPGKKIGYIAVHRLKQWAPDDYNTNFPNTGYYEAAINICKKWGVPVCDLTTNCPSLYEIDSLKQAYTTNADGWHPNEEGYLKYYVPKIEAWMKTL